MGKKLKELLGEDNIIVLDSVDSWQEAVEIASKPLTDKNIIERRYEKAMIDAVEKYGPYMVLSDGFALMHSRPEEGVNELGMSMLVLKNSVNLKGEPIRVFIVLAAVDSQSHLEGLADIASLIGDDKIFKKILKSDKKEIFELIKKGGEV